MKKKNIEKLAQIISQKSWNSRGLWIPAVVNKYPTMLSREELRMLYVIASCSYLTCGKILDLGCFMGGSTIALSAGVSHSSRQDKTVHSFDVFSFNQKQARAYTKKSKYGNYKYSKNGVTFVKGLLKEYAKNVRFYRGDITQQTIPFSKIALLFIDLDKSYELNSFLVDIFPTLHPGSIIIQQDFMLSKTPWTKWTMFCLKDKIQYLTSCYANSAIFMVKEKINLEDVAKAKAISASKKEIIEAHRYFINQASDFHHKEVLRLGMKRFKDNPNARKTHDFPKLNNREFYSYILNQELGIYS